jgi:hydrogenase maturation protease
VVDALDPDILDSVAAVADAVLFEGYLLYPYRASAQKNRLRWQFGVLTPDTDRAEPSRNRTECLFEPTGVPGELHVRLRFLQLQARSPRTPDGTPIAELVVDGVRHLRFEEGIPRQVDAVLAVADLLGGEVTVPVRVPAGATTEELRDGTGALVGFVERECWAVEARIVATLTDLPGPYLVHRLRLDVTNDGSCAPGAPREEVLRTSLIAAHTVVAARPGSFLSPVDPPEWAKVATKELVNSRTWPVLAGPEDRSDLLLSSPIILADHPQLAPESTVDLFDGLENDEILTLRTLVLTDAEKAEARATDPRAAGIIDAVDAMPPEILERLHGAIRSMRPGAGPSEVPVIGADSPAEQRPPRLPWWDPGHDDTVDPDTDSVLVGGVEVVRGSRVLLRPGPGTDAQDRFLDGLRATVQAVVHDVDGGVHVAVSVDGDPAAEMQLAHGRFRYFRPQEIEPAPVDEDAASRKVLVAGIGNVFRSDDGFGVEVVRALRGRTLPADVEVVDVGVRGMHLAFQLLDGYRALVIVDAVRRGDVPGTVCTLEHHLDAPPGAAAFDAHGMDPQSVLDQLDALAASMGIARPVERVFVVGCEPARLDDGIGLSPPVAAAVETAAGTVTDLVTSLVEGAVR